MTKLSESDLELAAFAISAELAARDLYKSAIDAGAEALAWELLREQHGSYAERLSGLTGISANTPDEALHAELESGFAGDRPANAAFALENTLAATHAELLVTLTDKGILEAIAAIVAMESRHAAYLAEISGRGGNLDALFVNGASPLTPEATS